MTIFLPLRVQFIEIYYPQVGPINQQAKHRLDLNIYILTQDIFIYKDIFIIFNAYESWSPQVKWYTVMVFSLKFSFIAIMLSSYMSSHIQWAVTECIFIPTTLLLFQLRAFDAICTSLQKFYDRSDVLTSTLLGNVVVDNIRWYWLRSM